MSAASDSRRFGLATGSRREAGLWQGGWPTNQRLSGELRKPQVTSLRDFLKLAATPVKNEAVARAAGGSDRHRATQSELSRAFSLRRSSSVNSRLSRLPPCGSCSPVDSPSFS